MRGPRQAVKLTDGCHQHKRAGMAKSGVFAERLKESSDVTWPGPKRTFLRNRRSGSDSTSRSFRNAQFQKLADDEPVIELGTDAVLKI